MQPLGTRPPGGCTNLFQSQLKEDTITLGEALSLRARQAQSLNDLKGRIKNCATSQEGTTPPEDVNALIQEYLNVSADHEALLVRIAETNAKSTVKVGEGTTAVGEAVLLDLLQRREALIRARNLYGLAAAAGSLSESSMRYMRTELKFVSNVDVADLRVKENDTNETIRVLDAQIQATNWQTELI